MTRKKAGGGLILALLLGAFARRADATSPATLTIKVTVNASLSLNIGTWGVYDFGSVAPGAVAVSSVAVVITNDSNGLVEDYTVYASTFIVTGGTNWNVSGSTAAAQDTFGLCAAIGPSAVTAASFESAGASNCISTTSGSSAQQNMDGSHFATASGDGNTGNGDHVQSAATRSLWLFFAAPTSVTTPATEVPDALVLTANNANLFP